MHPYTYTFPQFASALSRRGYPIKVSTLRNRLVEIAPPEATQTAAGRWEITVESENHLLLLAQRIAGPRKEG